MIRAKNALLVVPSLFLMAALFVSCVSTEVATSQEAKLSGDWTLVSMTEQGSEVVIPAGCTPSLSINEMEDGFLMLFGKAGVNNFNGSAVLDGETFACGPLALTMMAGDPVFEAIERVYTQLLTAGKTYSVTADTLEIKDADTNSLLQFKRVALPSTGWKLISYNTGNAVVSLDAKYDAPELVFISEDTVAGFAGVNTFNGKWSGDSATREISFAEEMATTRMAGPEELMTLENTFLGLLKDVTGYSMNGNTLTLHGEDGATLLVFVSK